MKPTGADAAVVTLMQLDEAEQVLLALLAALGPMTRRAFSIHVAAIELENPLTGRPLKAAPARALCDDLEARQLMFGLDDHTIMVAASIAHAALSRHAHHAALDRLIQIVSAPLYDRARFDKDLEQARQQTPDAQVIAHARVLLYRKQPAEAAQLIETYNRLDYAPHEDDERLWIDVIPKGSPSAAYALLPDAPRTTVMRHSLVVAYQYASHPNASLMQQAWQVPELQPWVVVVECLTDGPTPERVQALVELDDVPALQAQMFVALHHHDHAQARALAAQAVALANTQGKRALDALGLWAGVTLFVLGTGDASQQKMVRALLRALPKKRHGEVIIVFDLLNEDARDYSQRLDIVMTVLDAVRLSSVEQRYMLLGDEMAKRAEALRRRGFNWLATQCEHVATALSGSKRGANVRKGLVALCTPRATWEMALDGLDALDVEPVAAADRDAANVSKGERLVFEIALRSQVHRTAHKAVGDVGDVPDALEIRARLQVYKGSGWSKGREASPRTLIEADHDRFDDALDRRVISSLKTNPYYGHVTFSGRSALALVGHPRVYWGGDKQARPAEVVQQQAELLVRQAADGLRLRVWPAVNEEGIGYFRDSADRLVVVELDKEARAIAERLIDLPPVPPEGRARLEHLVQRLAARFAVRSDVELSHLAQAVRSVEPDCRPLIELRRAEPGLRARVCTQPLAGGPLFAPGIGERLVVAETADGRARCQRDLSAEQHAFERLCDAIAILQPAASGPVHIATLDGCLTLTKTLNDLGEQVRVVWADGEPLVIAAHANLDSLRMRVVEQGEWLSVHGTIEIDGAAVVDILNTMQARIAGGQFVALPDGSYLSLSPDVAQALDALAAVGTTEGKGKGEKRKLKLPPVALGFLGSWLRDVGHAQLNQRAQERLQRIEHAYAASPQVPRTFDAELRPYQQTGFAWLWRLCAFGGGACLADDMGLGKTLMTLALLLSRAMHGPALVVCPTSVRANWLSEAARFAPTLRMLSFDSGMLEQLDGLGAGDVLVCSYTLMAQQIEALEQRRWTTVVLDEAQSIKNLSAQRTLAAHRLLSDARVALTGTPVENHLGDLYSIMSFLNPGLLGSAEMFQQRFAKPIQNESDPHARSQLRTLIAPFVLRRRKSEVLRELPERTEITLRIEPSAQEQAFTEALRVDALARAKAARAQGLSPIMLLAEITKLRRAACCPVLVDKQATVGTAKLDAALELIEELRRGNHRALVFSQFVDFLGLVRARCEQAGISHQYLDGSTPEKKRQAAVNAFQSGEGDVFLISLKAGGFGLNLTAADYVIHLDPWWNPAVEAQASDRAHRIGQTRPVTVYRLVNAASIEEIVLRLHERKREVADDILEGTSQSTKLDATTLLTILEGP